MWSGRLWEAVIAYAWAIMGGVACVRPAGQRPKCRCDQRLHLLYSHGSIRDGIRPRIGGGSVGDEDRLAGGVRHHETRGVGQDPGGMPGDD